MAIKVGRNMNGSDFSLVNLNCDLMKMPDFCPQTWEHWGFSTSGKRVWQTNGDITVRCSKFIISTSYVVKKKI